MQALSGAAHRRRPLSAGLPATIQAELGAPSPRPPLHWTVAVPLDDPRRSASVRPMKENSRAARRAGSASRASASSRRRRPNSAPRPGGRHLHGGDDRLRHFIVSNSPVARGCLGRRRSGLALSFTSGRRPPDLRSIPGSRDAIVTAGRAFERSLKICENSSSASPTRGRRRGARDAERAPSCPRDDRGLVIGAVSLAWLRPAIPISAAEPRNVRLSSIASPW